MVEPFAHRTVESHKGELIGILAGMGAYSTAPFIDEIVKQCAQLQGAVYDDEFPPMMIYAIPTPFYIDRPVDWDKLRSTILAGLKRLVDTGVDFVAMPCNTAHRFYDDLAASIDVPLLHIVDCALASIKPKRNTAVLATESTMSTNLYQHGLQALRIPQISEEHWQAQVNAILGHVKSGAAQTKGRRAWTSLLRQIENAGVEQVIIACTDLNPAIDKHTEMHIVDSTRALAIRTVQQYFSTLS